MDSQYKLYGYAVRWRGLPYGQLSQLTRHILKQGMVVLCSISLLCQQGAAVPVLYGNAVKHIQDSHVVAYQYDAWSRLTDRTLPDGVSTVYRYDEYVGVSNITHYQTPQQQKVITRFTYIYNHDGSIAKRSRINGLNQQAIEQYGYDENNNLKDYQCSGALCPHDAQGKAIAYQHYTFDGFNNIKTITSNNTLTTYEYDQQIPTRLIDYHNSNPAYPSSQKLRYDPNGNILQDDQGNVITYDPLDQTRSVSTQQGTTTYFYNGIGRQIGEVIPNKPTTYFIYGQNTLLNTRVGSQQTSFLYGANRLGKQDDAGVQYYLTDQGGSVVNTINQTEEQAENINSYAYSPYGIESDLSKQASNTTSIQHFDFDGQLTDSQTHWQFLGQGYRAYNPMLHRFMSQDSMSPFDKGGINGYVFGSNNPIMMSDPTGHMSFWANMGIGFAIGIAAGMLTSEMGGWGALAINALAGAVGSNIDAIDNAVHGKAIDWKSVGFNAGIGAALGALGGKWGEQSTLEDIPLSKGVFPKVQPQIQGEITEIINAAQAGIGLEQNGQNKFTRGVLCITGLNEAKAKEFEDFFINYGYKRLSTHPGETLGFDLDPLPILNSNGHQVRHVLYRGAVKSGDRYTVSLRIETWGMKTLQHKIGHSFRYLRSRKFFRTIFRIKEPPGFYITGRGEGREYSVGISNIL